MQVALGVVGAVIGSYIPGAGTALGWAVGSAIGGMIDASNVDAIEGPKLNDLSTQISSYGVPVPRIYGTVGCAGNVIWALPLRQVATETGGKGGEPAAIEYSYYATFALLIGEGPLDLLRLWVQGKCIYDIRDQTNLGAIQASANFASYFTFYRGTSTQLPDPTMEATLGVGNVSAHLDESYIVFHDLPVGQFKNSPIAGLAIVAEVVHEGSGIVTGLRFLDGQASGVGPPDGGTTVPGVREIYPVTSGIVRIGGDTAANGVEVYSLDGSTHLLSDIGSEEERARPNVGTDPNNPTTYAGGALLLDNGIRCSYVGSIYKFSNPLCLLYIGDLDSNYDLRDLFDPDELFRGVIPCTDMVHFLVAYSPGDTESPYNDVDVYYKLFSWDGTSATLEATGQSLVDKPLCQGNTSYPGAGSVCGMLESDLLHFWLYTNTTAEIQYHTRDPVTGDWDLTEYTNYVLGIPELLWGAAFIGGAIWVDNGIAYLSSNDAYIIVTRNPGPPSPGETLEDVVLAESARAGLDSSLIEASTLASILVRGMRIARITTARSILGSLMSAYWFDMRQNGFLLEAVLRGNPSQFTIELDDIGAGIELSEAAEPVQVERLEDEALPGQIYIGYLNPLADYQWSTQGDRRSAVEIEQPSPIEVPLVLTDDEAKEIASVLLYSQWIGRTTRTVKVTRKYAYVQPADVGTFKTDDGDFLVRLVGMKSAGGLLEITGVDEEPALYSPNVSAAAVDRSTTVAGNTPTYFAFMNIPAQRPQDTDAGYYVAATGYTQPWPGARVYESTDGGMSHRSIGFISTPATMGPVPTALGNYAGSLLSYDTTSVLTVQFLYGTPQSVTDPEIAAGANKAAVGREDGSWEIIQYKTATLVSGNTWELTDLMRGVQGTDAYIGTHVDNEKFVLLDPSTLLRITSDPSTIGIDREYKVVTIGQQVSNAGSVEFANQGTSTSSAALQFSSWKESVRAATTANITLSGAQTIDGVSVIAGDRVLVKNQTAGLENGIYVAAAAAWTRAEDADAATKVKPGMAMFVSDGTANGNQGWWLTTNAPISLGTTALVFAQFTGSMGLDVKESVRAATTANITLSGAQTIDGVSVIAGDRVLVKNQSTGSQNGIYVAASGAWTRALDADTSGEVTNGLFTFIGEGTVHGDQGWVLTTNDPITLGTTALVFAKFNEFTGGILTSALNEAPAVTIASAGTVAIGAAAANTIIVTGTTTITAFDMIAASAKRLVVFTGVLTLTHNATSLILPGGANITTAAGDIAQFVSLGSGNWRCTFYSKANGQAVAGGASLTQEQVEDIVGALVVAGSGATVVYDDVTPALTISSTAATPAGSNTQLQYNNSGVFGASSTMTFDGTIVYLPSLSLTANNLNMTYLSNIAGFDSTAYLKTVSLAASSSGDGARLKLPHGVAPASPVDGDVWTTTAGLYVRINGSTVGPLN